MAVSAVVLDKLSTEILVTPPIGVFGRTSNRAIGSHMSTSDLFSRGQLFSKYGVNSTRVALYGVNSYESITCTDVNY